MKSWNVSLRKALEVLSCVVLSSAAEAMFVFANEQRGLETGER